MMDKEIIKRNFSRYAQCYDRYATVQNLCALRLITKVELNGAGKILDIGCGTGNYTKLLRDKFPSARIKALDISYRMIEIAKAKLQDEKIEFIVADAEEVELNGNYDLISSNASFQWLESLEGTLAKYRNLLHKNGVILFSTFGPLTFYELNASLKELFESSGSFPTPHPEDPEWNEGEEGSYETLQPFGLQDEPSGENKKKNSPRAQLFKKNLSISSCNFMDKVGLIEILEKHFNATRVEEELLVERHNSLLQLLNKIKYTGTRGEGINGKGLWKYKTLGELERIYRKKFKDLPASYQIFYCRAVR